MPKLAIIDATAAPADHSPCSLPASRYATSIANSPLIGHVLDELAAGGISEARIVAVPAVRRDLDHILRAGRTSGVEVSYSEALEGSERHSVLAELEHALAAGPVFLHPGDCLFRAQLATMQDRYRLGDVDSVLPAQAEVHPLRTPSERRASESPLLLGPGTRSLVKELLSPAGEAEDLVESLLHSDCRLAVCEQKEHWRYSDSTEGLLVANRMVLDALAETAPRESFGDNNQFHGRVSLSPQAFVSNCVIYGPVSIDDRAVVEDSFTGPYTAIGADAIVSGTEIDNSMVLAGAEVRHPGARIESSIIGERARVTRSFELPKGLHMRLGPDSRVTFS
ncbi:MAG: hypothetical protein ABI323_01580 [Solirubrobacteraceae bacterium]